MNSNGRLRILLTIAAILLTIVLIKNFGSPDVSEGVFSENCPSGTQLKKIDDTGYVCVGQPGKVTGFNESTSAYDDF